MTGLFGQIHHLESKDKAWCIRKNMGVNVSAAIVVTKGLKHVGR